MPNITSPSNIANEIYKAVENRKGKLHIISGGDAKFYAFLKKILSQRLFQKMQIRSIIQPLSKMEIKFAKWLMGSNTSKLDVDVKKN